MDETFLTFRVFNERETAEDLAEVLAQQGIDFFIEEDTLVFDPSYANNAFNKDYRLKLRQQDFEKAHYVLEDYFLSRLEKIDRDYYLFQFSDQELQEIVTRPDEWGYLDYLLAQKILSQRGKAFDPNEIRALKSKRISELSKPEHVNRSFIIWGYVLCLIFFPLAIFMGWNWAYSKKILPDGKKVNIFDDTARKHGRYIFALGLVVLIVVVILRTLLIF